MRVTPVVAKTIQVLWNYHCLRWTTPAPWKKKSGRQVAFHSSNSVWSKATDDVVIAYVHQLSPSKRNKKDTLYYSTLLLQTSENWCQDALLYSKQKHKLLSDSQKSHTPVIHACKWWQETYHQWHNKDFCSRSNRVFLPVLRGHSGYITNPFSCTNFEFF